jgi:hypothetical protein
MGQSFLRTDSDDGFGIRIDVDLVTPLVPLRDRNPKFVDAARHRVAVVLGFARCLNQLCHHVWRGRQIGVAHTEIDDVFPAMTRRHFHPIDDAKNVGRQPLNALKFHSTRPHSFSSQSRPLHS